MEHTKIIDGIEALIANRSTPIIAYCSAAKRSAQAVITLTSLGYENACNLGDMSAYGDLTEGALSHESLEVYGLRELQADTKTAAGDGRRENP